MLEDVETRMQALVASSKAALQQSPALIAQLRHLRTSQSHPSCVCFVCFPGVKGWRLRRLVSAPSWQATGSWPVALYNQVKRQACGQSTALQTDLRTRFVAQESMLGVGNPVSAPMLQESSSSVAVLHRSLNGYSFKGSPN